MSDLVQAHILVPLAVAFGGPSQRQIVTALLESALRDPRPPDEVRVDYRDAGLDALAAATRSFVAEWVVDGARERISMSLGDASYPVSLSAPRRSRAVRDIVAFVESAPVERAVGCDETGRSRTSFADMFCWHGWGVFFKGEGHRQLVSRRWLEHGPWLVHHAADDTTYVQFSDLEADVETQIAQRAVGHEQMGISQVGGFIDRVRPVQLPPASYYLPEQGRFEVPVDGRVVSETEMTDAAAIRVRQQLGPTRPVDTVAYVFAREAEARVHLHRMWLREIEVVTFVDGVRTVLGEGYEPAPRPPEWVRRLRSRGTGAQ